MNLHNPNKAITRIALPDQALPVLIGAEGKDKTGETSMGAGVRRITLADLDLCLRDYRQFELKFGRRPELDASQRKQIAFAVSLASAIKDHSVPQLKKAMIQLEGKEAVAKNPSLWPYREIPLRTLADQFNPWITEARPCVWWSSIGQRLSCGIWCPRIDVALFVLVLWKMGDIGAIGRCPRCKELFFRLRPSKKYCGDLCQAAAGMHRKRIRDKQRESARKRIQNKRNARARNGGKR